MARRSYGVSHHKGPLFRYVLAEEHCQFIRGVPEMRQEAGLHVECRDAGRIAAQIDRGDATSIGREDRDRERAETDLVLLITE